jgi:hypothetical protein
MGLTKALVATIEVPRQPRSGVDSTELRPRVPRFTHHGSLLISGFSCKTAVCIENLNPDVTMMKSAEYRA